MFRFFFFFFGYMFHNHHMLVVYRKSRGFSCFSFLFKISILFFRWTHSDDDDDDDGGPLAYWWWWWWTFVILTVAMLMMLMMMMMDYLIYTSDSSCLVSVSLYFLIEWLDLYFGVFIHSSIFFLQTNKTRCSYWRCWW